MTCRKFLANIFTDEQLAELKGASLFLEAFVSVLKAFAKFVGPTISIPRGAGLDPMSWNNIAGEKDESVSFLTGAVRLIVTVHECTQHVGPALEHMDSLFVKGKLFPHDGRVLRRAKDASA